MRRQFVTVAAASMALVLIVLLTPVLLLVRRDAEAAALAAGQVRAQAAAVSEPRPAALDKLVGAGFQISVFRGDGTVVGAATERTAEVERAARGGEFVTTPEDGGIALFVPAPGWGDGAAVRVFVTDDALHEGVGFRSLLVVLLTALMIGLGALLAAWLSSGVVRSITELADMAGRIAEGDLDARVTVGGPTEVRMVGDRLNRLTVRIEQMLDAQRRDASDLAHRLRTPMTAVQLDLDGARESGGSTESLDRLVHDVDALSAAINAVIRSARWRNAPAGHGPRGGGTPVDLGDIVRNRVRLWSVLAASSGRRLDVTHSAAALPVTADRADLEAALDALVANVFAHTSDGTDIAITTRAGRDFVSLVVDDSGTGFDDLQVDKRGRSGTSSTGLGLDIARRAAEATGGSQRLGRSPRGGARVELRFGTAG